MNAFFLIHRGVEELTEVHRYIKRGILRSKILHANKTTKDRIQGIINFTNMYFMNNQFHTLVCTSIY